jgi:hypothetical protein
VSCWRAAPNRRSIRQHDAPNLDPAPPEKGAGVNTLLITYDLSKPGQAYTKLIDHLKSYGTWWHHLESTWLVRTTEEPTEARNRLKPFLDENDKVLVLDVTGDRAAWRGLSQSATDWLHKHL